MKLRGIQSMALLLWGFQSDLLLFAVPMAVVWEGRFFFNRRWALTKQDFYLLADLTSVCLILMIVFLFLNRAEYHFIRTLMQWLPILFFPLTVTVGYSTTERLKLDALFYSLRRQKQPVTQSWNLDYLLFGLLLVGGGTSKELGAFYFPATGALIFLSLLPLRSPRHSNRVWFLVCASIFLAALLTHTGIRETHLELRKRAQVWLAQWIQQRTNPFKAQTSIGQIGQLKASDQILFRIEVADDQPVPRFLQEAVYDLPFETSWSVMDGAFEQQDHVDDFVWDIAPRQFSDTLVDVYHEFKGEKDLIPLPPGTTRIQDLPALNIQKSIYGVVQGLDLVPSPRYQVMYRPGENQTGPPTKVDLELPNAYPGLFKKIIKDNQMNPDQPLLSLSKFFEDFRYSLFQPSDLVSSPLEDFLLHRKAGHCEFFASTTVMLLREMGVPARYATGYAIQEYDDFLGMYVIRQRHAHAWALAYLDGRWRAVDTTPGVWLETEAQQSTMLQPLLDTIANVNFLFQVWWSKQKLEDYQIYLYGLAALLALILLWRISTSEQVILAREDDAAVDSDRKPKGNHSPLLDLAAALESKGFSRHSGEVLADWFSRIDQTSLLALVPHHNRLRFDPKGLTDAEIETLSSEVDRQIQLLQDQNQVVGKTD
jgi:hypothetical protein